MPPKKAIPTKRSRPASFYRKAALAKLLAAWEGEGDFDPSGERTVTPMLKTAQGGIATVLEALRAHDDEDARAFIELYDSLSKHDREFVSLEQIAYAAGIGSLRLAEVATSANILHGQMTSKLILASGLPGIVKTSVRLAKTTKGGFDREMMLKAGGVLPVPKGAQTVINTNVIAEKAIVETEAEPQYLDSGERLRLIHEAVEPRRLPSPPSEPIDLGGRLSHMQDETAEVLAGDV